jgi:uncharacterized NAD(P)/FAD-binding protein YdhS
MEAKIEPRLVVRDIVKRNTAQDVKVWKCESTSVVKDTAANRKKVPYNTVTSISIYVIILLPVRPIRVQAAQNTGSSTSIAASPVGADASMHA